MLADRLSALDLCRQEPGALKPGALMELRRQMQGLADWWLCPEVLERMRLLVRREPRPACPPKAAGSCWILLAQRQPWPFPAVCEAFALPLQWRRACPDSPCLPPRLHDLARAVVRALYQPEWGLHLDAGLGSVDLAQMDAQFEEVGSCWAPLACGLLVAAKGGTVNTHVWATGCWDEDAGVARVEHLWEKMRAAYRYGAREFFLPDSQLAEAEGVDLGEARLTFGKLYTGTLDPQRALRDYLFRLDLPPPAPAGPEDVEGFDRCMAYYLRQPRERRETAEYYRDCLLPTIIERCRAQRERDWPGWKPKALVTIVSGSPDLVALSARATEVGRCLLLYTPHEQAEKDQTKAMTDVKELLLGQGVCCVEGAFSDGPAMREEIPTAIRRFRENEEIDPVDLVLDITPGNKWMNWVSDHAMPAGSWRLYVRNDTLSPADRRPKPGSEELIVWRVGA
jgi:hypothetical protein